MIKGSLPGFELLPLPVLPALLAVPEFEPAAPRGALVLFTVHGDDAKHPEASWTRWRIEVDNSSKLDEVSRFALPADYAQRLATLHPDLGTTPILGQTRRWAVTIGGLSQSPLWVRPVARLVNPFAGALPGAHSPGCSDLDRDGIPELWWFPTGDDPGLRVELPRLSLAPGAPGPDNLSTLPWLRLLAGATAVRCFDLDEDLFEELFVLRRDQPVLILRNASDLSLDPVEEDVQLRDPAARRIDARGLGLGPVRGDLQWVLAYGGQRAWLLARPVPGIGFEAHPAAPALLSAHPILDARILDRDGDGDEELLVLATTDEGPELMLWKLPDRKDGAVLLDGRGLVVRGATGLRVGDVDADGGPDLCIVRGREAPVVLRNSSFPAVRVQTMRLALEGPTEQPHAIGATVDVIDRDNDNRFVRYRWPPQDQGDQPMLFLSWVGRESVVPRLRVTWSDGNVQQIDDLQLGTYRFLKR